jgi:hypothetical protein
MIVKLNRPRLAVKGACFCFTFMLRLTGALKFARFGVEQEWLCVLTCCMIVYL